MWLQLPLVLSTSEKNSCKLCNACSRTTLLNQVSRLCSELSTCTQPQPQERDDVDQSVTSSDDGTIPLEADEDGDCPLGAFVEMQGACLIGVLSSEFSIHTQEDECEDMCQTEVDQEMIAYSSGRKRHRPTTDGGSRKKRAIEPDGSDLITLEC